MSFFRRGIFAALHESGFGPERHLLRDSNTSGIGGKAEVASALTKIFQRARWGLGAESLQTYRRWSLVPD